MQPGSAPPGIGAGSLLRRGQVIGRVGNTGSSTAPHLHFHITDGPLAVGSEGRPYVFDRFNFTRVVTNPDAVEHNGPGRFRPAPAPVPRHRQLPLTGDVVDFP